MSPSEDKYPTSDLTVGQMSARSGVAVSALHYYEAEGLIRSSRTAAGHRRFDRRELRRVAVIRVAQSLGLSLADIRAMLDRVPQGKPVRREDWQAASAVGRDALDNRIERLLRLRDQLDHCIGCGCLSLEACPLNNANDRLASDGSGPRRWMSGAAGE
jgi:MerR family transcriptional regulator, redox-sensitive transcriptional activator SoxR|tara:strand:+ start:1107 stop:1580 length:474 start_codon:yes stop_codon:yes gene_type:complete